LLALALDPVSYLAYWLLQDLFWLLVGATIAKPASFLTVSKIESTWSTNTMESGGVPNVLCSAFKNVPAHGVKDIAIVGVVTAGGNIIGPCGGNAAVIQLIPTDIALHGKHGLKWLRVGFLLIINYCVLVGGLHALP